MAEHVWTSTYQSIDGERRRCECGRLEENDGFGWRVVLPGVGCCARAVMDRSVWLPWFVKAMVLTFLVGVMVGWIVGHV